MQHKPARRLQRGKRCEQRTAQEIHSVSAAHHVEAATLPVGFEHVLAARIAPRAQGRRDTIGKRRSVAKAEIESLGADRRQDMRCLADQRDALRRETIGDKTGDRKFGARANIGDRTEQALEAP